MIYGLICAVVILMAVVACLVIEISTRTKYANDLITDYAEKYKHSFRRAGDLAKESAMRGIELERERERCGNMAERNLHLHQELCKQRNLVTEYMDALVTVCDVAGVIVGEKSQPLEFLEFADPAHEDEDEDDSN